MSPGTDAGRPMRAGAEELRAAGGDQPTIPFPGQPRPHTVRVVYLRVLRWTITAIFRGWLPGDSGPGGRCRLCRKCKAYDDGCLIVVGIRVPRESAGLFSSLALLGREPGVVLADDSAGADVGLGLGGG
jgi:hypothetical protein